MLTTLTVTSLSDDTLANLAGDGELSLREAIEAANLDTSVDGSPAGSGADTIQFAPGLAGGTITLAGTELAITDDLTINGLGAGQLTISGNNATRIFSVEADVAAEISDVTIADGYAEVGGGVYNLGTLALTKSTLTNNTSDGNAGAIFNEGGASVIISHSVLSHNSAGASGGAISNYAGSGGPYGALTITGSVFSENDAGAGGAIWNDGPVTITASSFLANFARNWGGGIAHGRNTLTISDSTFANNNSNYYGGGIDISSRGVLEISNSTLSGNSTGRDGGAIYNLGGTMELTNSTLSGNSSNRYGGGIRNVGELKITNSTLVLNRADADGDGSGSGGGLYNVDSTFRPSPVLNNTILAGNLLGAIGSDSANDFSGTADTASANNLIGDATTAGGLTHGLNGNMVGNAGTGTIDIATVIDTNLADNGGPTLTHRLVEDSPALDAGDDSKAVDGDGIALAYDQRGESFARIYGGTVDIGALEVQHLFAQIDIKPGSDPSSINLASNGVIAVAIFTTDDFDAATVDAGTVSFAGADAVHSTLEDVDGDGDLDLVLHFQVQDTNLAAVYAELLAEDTDGGTRQTTAVSLSGETIDGEEIIGMDEVDLFFSGKALRELLDSLGIF